MQDREMPGLSLFTGARGEELRKLADSDEGRALARKIDGTQAERAVRSGDVGQMKALLQSVLSTPEGRALAEKLSRMGL